MPASRIVPDPRGLGCERTRVAGGHPAPWVLTALLASSLSLLGGGCRSRLQLSRGDASVVVTSAPQANTVGARALTELEPNGARGVPTVVALGATPGEPLEITGALGDEDDEDRFSVELGPAETPPPPAPPPASDGAPAAPLPPPPPPVQLALELVPGDKLTTTLTAATPEGRVLGVATAGPGESSGLPNLAVTPGTRVLVTLHRNGHAVPAGPASSYKLVLRLGPLAPGDEREPNESAAEATPLGPAHTAPEVAGLFGGAKDVDWFSVPIGAAGESTAVSIELEPPAAMAGSLAVHDGGGGKLAAAKGRKGGRVVLRQLSPAALGAGSPAGAPVFFVAVRSESGADREHRYLLRIRSEDAPPGEREPNDDGAHSNPLGDGALLGFAPAGDVDVYRIGGRRGQPLTIALVTPPHADLVLEALPPGESRWVKADAGRRGQPETLSVTPAADGDVLVRVTAKRGAETQDEPYRITAETSSAPSTP